MPNYDFLNLSPIEFEELSRDLLQKHFNVYLESFTQGRDKGIDCRYSQEKAGSFILQCKRYKDYNLLKSSLKKEHYKVSRLNPMRYILTTTVGLTPDNKDEILSLLGGFIKSTSDIFGRDDLNNLLGVYDDVEKHHFKLWLSSWEVLNKLINLDIVGRSEFEFEEIKRNIKVYVQNESYSEAANLLNKHNYIIISGIPGIGKTTLARMLCYQYIAKGYELVAVSGDINEAEKTNPKRRKQVFYYDDFLGTNFLEMPLQKNEDKRLIQFIERISRSKSNKLIMTTREYILNQAKLKYEILDSKKVDISKCIVDLSKYTKKVRAEILYNHLYFSLIPNEYIESLLHKKRYFHIIDHPNYNPRLIQFMTTSDHIRGIESADYYDFFINNLNNPVDIWRHAFENQITHISRYVLFGLLLSGGYTTLEALKTTFENIINNEKKKYSLDIIRDGFKKSLKELENTFIKIVKDAKEHIVEFQNPSIQDFLINYINENDEIIRLLIVSAIYFNQLTTIFSVQSKGKNENKIVLNNEQAHFLGQTVIEKYKAPSLLMKYFMDRGGARFYYSKYELKEVDKLFEISELFNLKKYDTLRKFALNRVNEIIQRKSRFSNIGGYLKLLIRLRDEKSLLKKEGILLYISNMDDIEAVEELDFLEEYFPEEYKEVIDELGHDFAEHIEEAINNDVHSYIEMDKNTAEAKIAQIEDIRLRHSEHSVNFSSITTFLEEKLTEESAEEESSEKLDDYKENIRESEVQDKYIEELFDTLKQ